MKLSETKKASDVKAKVLPRRTKYQNILDRMAKLKKGQAFEIRLPKGVTPRMYHNRLNAVLCTYDIRPPKGCVFQKRTTVNDKVAIKCVKK